MMINIRRIIGANEMRFADESHSSKFKRWGRWGGGIEAGRKKKERRMGGGVGGGGGGLRWGWRARRTQEGAVGQRSSLNLMVLTKIH